MSITRAEGIEHGCVSVEQQALLGQATKFGCLAITIYRYRTFRTHGNDRTIYRHRIFTTRGNDRFFSIKYFVYLCLDNLT